MPEPKAMKVHMEFTSIEKLKVATRVVESTDEKPERLVSTISFETDTNPIKIAKLLALLKDHAAIYVDIGSLQAIFDIFKAEVEMKSAVVAEAEELVEGKGKDKK